MECAWWVVNHVKAFFVRELGNYLILKFSLFVRSPASIKYREICSIMNSLVSPTNFVNLGTFCPIGSSVCKPYSDKGDVEFSLYRPMFTPFCTIILSNMGARLFSPNTFSCRTWRTTWSVSWSRLTTKPGDRSASPDPPCLTTWGTNYFPWFIIFSSRTFPSFIISLANWDCTMGQTCTGGAPNKSVIRITWVANCW